MARHWPFLDPYFLVPRGGKWSHISTLDDYEKGSPDPPYIRQAEWRMANQDPQFLKTEEGWGMMVKSRQFGGVWEQKPGLLIL